MEYLIDYGDEELKNIGEKFIQDQIENIAREDIKNIVTNNLVELKKGKRDLYL